MYHVQARTISAVGSQELYDNFEGARTFAIRASIVCASNPRGGVGQYESVDSIGNEWSMRSAINSQTLAVHFASCPA